jgi:hypothetical protein
LALARRSEVGGRRSEDRNQIVDFRLQIEDLGLRIWEGMEQESNDTVIGREENAFMGK